MGTILQNIITKTLANILTSSLQNWERKFHNYFSPQEHINKQKSDEVDMSYIRWDAVTC